MKKILSLIIVAATLFLLTSCGTIVAAETTSVAAEIEYYDYGMGYVVVYLDGIPNYRFWNDDYSRYYYRPVPHARYSYIRTRPMHHHHYGPAHRPHHRPDVRHRPHHSHPSHHSVQPRRPGGNHHTRPNINLQNPSSTRHSGSGHFGGRR